MVKTWDPSQMRQDNRATIMNLLWEHPEISRANLARLTGMSRSTISGIISQLLDSRLVEEVGAGESQGGRKPINLHFRASAFHTFGIQIGQHETRLALLDLKGTLLHGEPMAGGIMQPPEEFYPLLKDSIDKILQIHQTEPLLGLGIALPFPVASTRSFKVPHLVFPSWQDFPLIENLQRDFQCPVLFDNDANLGALAQQWLQDKRGEHLAFIEMADGFGAGLILNGHIFRGSAGYAGEIGHMTVEPRSDRWHRGIQGAVNALISGQALQVQVKGLKAKYPESPLSSTSSIEDVVVQAVNGDPLAYHLCTHLAKNLGVVISNMINLLNLESIVIGGPLAQLQPDFFQLIQNTVNERTIWPEVTKTQITAAPMGRNQIVIGAGTQVIVALIHGDLQLTSWAPRNEAPVEVFATIQPIETGGPL